VPIDEDGGLRSGRMQPIGTSGWPAVSMTRTFSMPDRFRSVCHPLCGLLHRRAFVLGKRADGGYAKEIAQFVKIALLVLGY